MTESFEYRDHNWKGLSLQSKCDAIHHIFSMPVFHGKFDHLLELVCPKEQTTSTSSTSTTPACSTLPGGLGSGSGTTLPYGMGPAANYQCSQGDECFDCKLLYCPFHRFNHLLYFVWLTHVSYSYSSYFINIIVAGGAGCPGSTYCNMDTLTCKCFVGTDGNPERGCCYENADCAGFNNPEGSGLRCDYSNAGPAGVGCGYNFRCIPDVPPASSPSK